ncbi:MAG: sialate O-acetylesterase [Pirellulaceae bacterium]|nr:sialate O-acetylesterase [Pirellulaceae bacterium]
MLPLHLRARHVIPGLILLIGLFHHQMVLADIRLPNFFSNHMVLQQKMPIKIWGWANPNELVTVSLAGNTRETKTNSDGKWQIELPAMTASKEPHVLRVNGNQSSQPIELKDVLVGEVWLCSGQSNMEWSVAASGNPDAEIKAANHPLIRHLKVPRNASPTPQADIGDTQWEVCSPATAASFTAAGYYAARRLQEELDVPIGLINSSWGGTRVEPWTSTVGMQQVPALKDLHQLTMQRTPGTAQHIQRMNEHVEATAKWLDLARSKTGTLEITPPSPAHPNELRPLNGSGEPTALYNGMIHPLVGLPIRGAFWYQGESNRSDGMMYFEKKKALIEGWRSIWEQGDFPFLFVQIAPFQYGNDNPETLPELWEAQSATLSLPNTGMVVTNDITTLNNIHPPNKQDVGKRLANLALQDVYGRKVAEANSPEFKAMEMMPGGLKVIFDTAGELKTRDNKPPSHFELIGVGSNGFQPATAKIVGNSVILKSPTVSQPTAFRFAWDKLAEPNLTGPTGLPVAAVRHGKIPTFMESLPDSDQYKLVYDLDLNKLGRTITYDIDRASTIKNFDRIGYLLELKSQALGDQKLFVSLAAFTDDAKKIGIPTPESAAAFQQEVKEVEVFSNTSNVPTSKKSLLGNMEFWPNNYAEENAASVPGASDQRFDFGDRPYGVEDGYGSMQIHDTQGKRTLFAINHWRQGVNADIGIGNSPGANSDWTFRKNAKNYDQKRLRIYVRQKADEK